MSTTMTSLERKAQEQPLVASNQIQKLVKDAKKSRINRCYYFDCFNITDVRVAGLTQSDEKSALDQVIIDKSENEVIEYFGLDQRGSQLQISLSIWSLYPNVEKANEESRWRLARVKFTYLDAESPCRYSYEHEQLIDYESKRAKRDQYDTKCIYKIGSMSIEVVSAFTFSRILFNGIIKRNLDGKEDFASVKISISTHPVCDKHDHRFKFSEKYLTKIIQDSEPNSVEEAQRLIDLVREDRIDQSFMFQGRMENMDSDTGTLHFVLWGMKVKRFVDPIAELSPNNFRAREPTESLIIWSECGHLINLTRPLKYLNLVYGSVDNHYDYASFLQDSKLFQKNGDTSNEVSFDQLSSFSQLTSDFSIQLKSFTKKILNITFETSTVRQDDLDSSSPLVQLEATINNFKSRATVVTTNIPESIGEAQSNLWTLMLGDHNWSNCLASEKLLGGKGNSLITLEQLTRGPLKGLLAETDISVPRGLVLSCLAYDIWLKSSPLIDKSIRELDNTRLSLAARSIYTNTISEKHVNLAQSQQILRDQCNKTSLILKSCPLTPLLRRHLLTQLLRIFTEEDLRDPAEEDEGETKKLFAVRSSAVGEDAIETSAAGQMKTILDARGFESICRSVVECWASQFELEAVIYKTQNGLPLNLPMAVVVQELVNCRVAGVGSTCDPLTGNKNEIQILANRGLGEGVVSGKQTDTIRVPLTSLAWNYTTELRDNFLKLNEVKDSILKQSDSNECCLEDEEIVRLANVILAIRHSSEIRDRELEWGITSRIESPPGSSSSSSSSASSGSFKRERFCIHLLQSRPLTHLHRLNSHEIDHELDYGISSPKDVVTRANLGEVMPGALCPIFSTYFHPVVSSMRTHKPFEKFHTKKAFASDTFAFHGQMAMMVLTYSDSINRFVSMDGPDAEMRRSMVDAMIGTKLEARGSKERDSGYLSEKVNPNSTPRHINFGLLLALDSKVAHMVDNLIKRRDNNHCLTEDLNSIDKLIEQVESEKSSGRVFQAIRSDIEKLFTRLCTRMAPLADGWNIHLKSTLLSMAFNMICLQILAEQPFYPSKVNAHEVLNDFSILVQDPKSSDFTVGGQMSQLLSDVCKHLALDGQLEATRSMNNRQLYEFLDTSSGKSGQIFREFLAENAHRAYKEFDFATLTWGDEPSYVIKSLALRLKQYNETNLAKERESTAARAQEQAAKQDEILNKVEKSKRILTSFALPRARRAVKKREQSKSFLIKMINKYRQAFRHLGALLCLEGRLPSANLIFFLALEELDLVVNANHEQRSDLSRVLYKARRRQQRQKIVSSCTFPDPTMEFLDAVKTVRKVSEPESQGKTASVKPSASASDPTSNPEDSDEDSVKGITSCAGCVTGRACVVRNIEDMDQIEAGDILVTYSIDISWSVYFFTLSGIVTEVGGIVSHGAVIAREYGIPTLCTAVGACSKFKTGQQVTLNADQGICFLVPEESNKEAANGFDSSAAEVATTSAP